MDYIVYYICIHTIYPKYKMKKHIYTAAFFPIIFLITADALPAQELTCDAISCGSSTCKYFPANISDCRELYLDKIYHLHGLLTIFGGVQVWFRHIPWCHQIQFLRNTHWQSLLFIIRNVMQMAKTLNVHKHGGQIAKTSIPWKLIFYHHKQYAG